jgi:AAA+ ATPase superfamily predicted ATPase
MYMIGRQYERLQLSSFVEGKKSEFIVVFGRRRVGKTYLVREFFNDKFAFSHTGMAKSTTKMQLQNFNASLNHYGSKRYPIVDNWFDAFEQLIHLLSHKKTKSKKAVFLDEIPWMDTPRSGFIAALEHFWNGWAAAQKDMLLIVCGSATSWMTNEILKNHGGLHNRVTQQIYLHPFTLSECEEYFEQEGMELSRSEIVENYMVFGGIPYYLSLMKKRLSLTQNVDNLCFSNKAPLQNEFENLYASLFRKCDNYIKIVEALSAKTKGLTRDEIIESTGLANGGSFTRILNDLELCGFIRKYRGFDKKQRECLYQLSDFFTLFYFNFIKKNKFDDLHYWTNAIDNARRRAWSGYAFEQVCLAHLPQIKHKLGIAGVLTKTASWRSNDKKNAAQIDLLIERNDKVINLCEIKYAVDEFVIDKQYDEILRKKRAAFKEETKTTKTIHITMITTNGVRHNQYWGHINSEITMNDLFEFID